MREVDRLTTERYGVPSLQLMENAGTRVVEFLEEEFADLRERRTVLLCGKGNNGGDGLVVARLLKQRGHNPQVFLLASPENVKGDAAVNLKRWQQAGGSVVPIASAAEWEINRPALAEASVVIDALLGTGLNGPVEGLLAGVIEDVNRLCGPSAPLGTGRKPVVAVDIPSGLPSDGAVGKGPVVRAGYTITFTAPKLGLILPAHAEWVGELHVRAIGSPAELLEEGAALRLRSGQASSAPTIHWLEPSEFKGLPLVRRPASHKGDYGHALILAGSLGKTGAAVLAAWGALRAGAGLVTVGTSANVLPIVASLLPEMMTEALQGTESDSLAASNLDYGRLPKLLQGKNVVAIGPGISPHPETQQFVRAVLAECALPVILDADGLNALAGRADELRQRKCPMLAITPHPGEMARLCGCSTAEVQSRRLEVALEKAAAWNAYVVLKGFRTVVATPDGRAFVNSTGNPGMATGGTGDVLTGILTGLTAQLGTAQWERVLSLGVYLHGLAGDLAAGAVGEMPLMATDLVHALPQAFQHVLAELDYG